MRLEDANLNYKNNLALAFRVGLNIPKIIYFDKAPEEEMELINSNPRQWRIIENRLAVEKKKGMRITYTTYYSGGKFKFVTASFHRRNILAGGLAPVVDENLITLFHVKKCPVIDKFQAIVDIEPDYKGIIQIEILLDGNGKVWYEVIRLGANLEYLVCLNEMHKRDDGKSVPIESIEYEQGFVAGCMVYGFPNVPWKGNADFIYSTSISSYAVHKEPQIGNVWKELYNKLKSLKDVDLCWRNDGGDKEKKQWYAMRKKTLV